MITRRHALGWVAAGAAAALPREAAAQPCGMANIQRGGPVGIANIDPLWTNADGFAIRPWLSAERGGGGRVMADREMLGPWETFQMVPVGFRTQDVVDPTRAAWWYFVSHAGFVLRSDGGKLVAYRNSLGRLSEFYVRWGPGGGGHAQIGGHDGWWRQSETSPYEVYTDWSDPGSGAGLDRRTVFQFWGG